MSKEIPDVLSLCDADFKAFIDSFDTIVTDCDGVLWNLVPLPGVKNVLQRMRKLGKNIYHVSNNAARPTKDFETLCSDAGANLDDVITPATSIIQYLESNNCNGKKIFALASDVLKDVLIKAGYEIAALVPEFNDSFEDFIRNTEDNDPEIKIVLFDFDPKLNYQNLLKAISILNRPDVIFLAGATDRYMPLNSQRIIPGPEFFFDIIVELTERRPIPLAKPSEWLRDIVMRNFNITDARRTLFIGDTLKEDIGFGSLCGFQKLLVLSGNATLKAAEECVNPEYRPDYYIQSLGHLAPVLDKLNT